MIHLYAIIRRSLVVTLFALLASLPLASTEVYLFQEALLFSTPAHAASAQQTEFDCTTVSEIPLIECETLVTLYQDTDGNNWKTNTDWLITTTPCSWYGITCQENHVTEIRLAGGSAIDLISGNPGFGLRGSIPPVLGNLSELTKLNLS